MQSNEETNLSACHIDCEEECLLARQGLLLLVVVQRLLWRSLTVLSWRREAALPAAVSVSVLGALSSFSKVKVSFSEHSRRLISIELLSWTNSQPPVWMNKPESFLAWYPSPWIKCYNQSSWVRKIIQKKRLRKSFSFTIKMKDLFIFMFLFC